MEFEGASDMIKKLLLVLLVIVVCGADIGAAYQTLVFSEDFESTPVGSLPFGWSMSGNDVAYVTDETSASGFQSYRMGHDQTIRNATTWEPL